MRFQGPNVRPNEAMTLMSVQLSAMLQWQCSLGMKGIAVCSSGSHPSGPDLFRFMQSHTLCRELCGPSVQQQEGTGQGNRSQPGSLTSRTLFLISVRAGHTAFRSEANYAAVKPVRREKAPRTATAHLPEVPCAMPCCLLP